MEEYRGHRMKCYPNDLMWSGPNSDVKIIHIDGTVEYKTDKFKNVLSR